MEFIAIAISAVTGLGVSLFALLRNIKKGSCCCCKSECMESNEEIALDNMIEIVKVMHNNEGFREHAL